MSTTSNLSVDLSLLSPEVPHEPSVMQLPKQVEVEGEKASNVFKMFRKKAPEVFTFADAPKGPVAVEPKKRPKSFTFSAASVLYSAHPECYPTVRGQKKLLSRIHVNKRDIAVRERLRSEFTHPLSLSKKLTRKQRGKGVIPKFTIPSE